MIDGKNCLSLIACFWCCSVITLDVAYAKPNQNSQAFSENLRARVPLAAEQENWSLQERMQHYGVPGIAVAILQDGKLVHTAGYGVLQSGKNESVNADTVFSVGSVSKVITAAMSMRLADQGQLNLDQDVRQVLKSWQLPRSALLAEHGVNTRMLLSHTAGLNLHGFGDFLPGAELPNVVQTLTGTRPAMHEGLKFIYQPGTDYRYSGGGYTLLQLMLSDITGQAFPLLAKNLLIEPLGLRRSTFTNPLPESHGNIAKAHNRSGRAVALPRGYEAMPEMAASGFWTSANDLGRFVAMLIRSYRQPGGYIQQDSMVDMMTKVIPSEHGLGPRIEGSGSELMFHHGGANNSYRAWIEGHLNTGDGLVVLSNGTNGNDLIMEIRNAVADVMGWTINRRIKLPDLKLPQEHLASLVGKYSVDEVFPKSLRQQLARNQDDIRISLGGNGLLLSSASGNHYELVPYGPDEFLIPSMNTRIGIAKLSFFRNALKQVLGVKMSRSGAENYYIPQQ